MFLEGVDLLKLADDLLVQAHCNVSQLTPGYVYMSVTQSKMTQSNSSRCGDDRSGGAMRRM